MSIPANLAHPPVPARPCRPSPLVGDGLLRRDPLILLHLHQARHQLLGWGHSTGKSVPGRGQCGTPRPTPGTGLTRLRDVIPVRWVELIVPGQDFAEEVLVVVLVVILVCLLIEGGVPREAEGWDGGSAWPLAPGLPWPPQPSPCTHRMYMMTPMAQQSTGRPYRCRPTTSGAVGNRKAALPWGPQHPSPSPPGPESTQDQLWGNGE